MSDPITFNHPGDIAAAIKAGLDQVQLLPAVDDHRRQVIIPKSSEIRALERERLSRPRFLTAAPTFHDVVAFIAYVNAFKDQASRIFYNQEGKFVAVLDHHQEAKIDGQRHGDHLAILALKRSPEWEAWAKHSEQPMGQQTFAEFIEDNARDILEPDPATMLKVASGLHATVGATFRQATNQANGQIQLAFDETINGTVSGTTEAVPTTFQVGLRPFMGCSRYPVDCRLRYRIDRSSGAMLKLHYKALHLDPITEVALEDIVAIVKRDAAIAPALGSHSADAFAKGQ